MLMSSCDDVYSYVCQQSMWGMLIRVGRKIGVLHEVFKFVNPEWYSGDAPWNNNACQFLAQKSNFLRCPRALEVDSKDIGKAILSNFQVWNFYPRNLKISLPVSFKHTIHC